MTRTFPRPILAGGLVAATVGLAATGAFAQINPVKFDTYDNEKHGFSLTFPANKFQPLPQSTPDGWQAISNDGNARLLVGTIANFDGKSLAAYRTFLLNAAYPGAKIDYAPVRDTWFVLSGVRKDGITAFYQRVNFVCGGRNINSWAVIFPYAEEPTYSKIIDQVHRDYAVGAGNCDRSTMAEPKMQPKTTAAMDPKMQPKPMGAMEKVMTGTMEMEPKQMGAMEPAMQTKQAVTADATMQPKQAAAATPQATQPKQQMAMATQPAMQPKQPPAAEPKQPARAGFDTYENNKHGFSLVYSTAQFIPLPQATPDLFQAVSKDGKTRLSAGTIANYDNKSLGAYRTFLLNAAYANAKLGDVPTQEKGFVLAGVKSDGTTAFYHRVSFVCGWSNINSWSVLYPAQEKDAYAKTIEQIDRDYVVGDGNCNQTVMK
jgi:hypothetical protein